MAREKGKGGLMHRSLQKRFASYFIKQGKVAVIEPYIGRNTDVLIFDADKTICLEIQFSEKNCLQVKNNFELGCTETWVICESPNILNNIRNKIKTNLEKTLFEKTKFYLIKDFFPRANKNNSRISRNKVVEENIGIKPNSEGR